MRITRDNVESARERAENLIEALERFRDAAETWLEEPDAENADERRSAREEMEGALDELESLGLTLG